MAGAHSDCRLPVAEGSLPAKNAFYAGHAFESFDRINIITILMTPRPRRRASSQIDTLGVADSGIAYLQWPKRVAPQPVPQKCV